MPSVSLPANSALLRCGDFALALDEPVVMGIVNVTPDSFSDGGRFATPGGAIEHAQRLVDDGAAIVDLGAESTRPGATPIGADEEWRRLEPVLAGLRDLRVPISIDTRHPRTMERALARGASMINDIEAFADPASRDAVRASGCGLCAMHMRGTPQTMQVAPTYDDVVDEVDGFLRGRVAALVAEGVDADRIVVDPGFGFGKTFEHNLALFGGLDRLAASGRPVLVGLSRKGMIGRLTGRPPGERAAGSVAAALLAVERGARIVRAHDVAETADALRVWTGLRGAGRASKGEAPVIASGPLTSRVGR